MGRRGLSEALGDTELEMGEREGAAREEVRLGCFGNRGKGRLQGPELGRNGNETSRMHLGLREASQVSV